MRATRVVDANAFLGKWPYWRMEVNTGDQLARHLERNGIQAAVVSSLRSTFADVEEGNAELLRACRNHPDTIFGLATLTPFTKKSGAGMQGLSSGEFKGIRLAPQYHGYPLGNASRVFETAESLHVPVVIPLRMIATWNLPTLSMAEILSTVGRFPKVPFVVSGTNYEAMVVLSMENVPQNLHFESSCLQWWDAVKLLAGRLGTARILLGTGTPVQYAQSGIGNVLESSLSPTALPKVAASNAETLFHLKG